MNAAYIYLQLYRLFDNSTPIKADCGKLCNSLCCDGDDCGMYLFPGEIEVYKLLSPAWAKIEKSDFFYDFDGKQYNVPLLMCDGNCSRFERPLACRIFPLTPYIKNGKLEIIVDPRAKRLCPLANGLLPEDFDRDFTDNVKKAFVLLMKNSHIRQYMKEYSLYLDDFLKFYN